MARPEAMQTAAIEAEEEKQKLKKKVKGVLHSADAMPVVLEISQMGSRVQTGFPIGSNSKSRAGDAGKYLKPPHGSGTAILDRNLSSA